jgi:hypothetical protein
VAISLDDVAAGIKMTSTSCEQKDSPFVERLVYTTCFTLINDFSCPRRSVDFALQSFWKAIERCAMPREATAQCETCSCPSENKTFNPASIELLQDQHAFFEKRQQQPVTEDSLVLPTSVAAAFHSCQDGTMLGVRLASGITKSDAKGRISFVSES